MATHLVGHLDPAFLELMDETVQLLRYAFQSGNKLTIPVSGTGSAGLEASVCNVVEPGDTIVTGVNGLFGERLAEVASRYGANVVKVQAEWGKTLAPEQFEEALKGLRDVKMVAIVHAETSTGVMQPLEEIGRIVRDHGALFLVDAVTSIAGADLQVDQWGIDVCYSGTQKCIGAPPGLSPVTMNERAGAVLDARKAPVTSWYLDMSLLRQYWGQDRVYHHTAPISMIYALREALRLVHEEGLAARQARHRKNSRALWAGLESLGLELLVPEEYRAVPLTTVRIPDGVNDAALRSALLNDFGIEIGGGLGAFKGKAWRIGLMGYNSSPMNVLALLSALEQLLPKQGFEVARGAGVDAADKALGGD